MVREKKKSSMDFLFSILLIRFLRITVYQWITSSSQKSNINDIPCVCFGLDFDAAYCMAVW